eukprot:796533-Prorocentrum_minimum.AAC.2
MSYGVGYCPFPTIHIHLRPAFSHMLRSSPRLHQQHTSRRIGKESRCARLGPAAILAGVAATLGGHAIAAEPKVSSRSVYVSHSIQQSLFPRVPSQACPDSALGVVLQAGRKAREAQGSPPPGGFPRERTPRRIRHEGHRRLSQGPLVSGSSAHVYGHRAGGAVCARCGVEGGLHARTATACGNAALGQQRLPAPRHAAAVRARQGSQICLPRLHPVITFPASPKSHLMPVPTLPSLAISHNQSRPSEAAADIIPPSRPDARHQSTWVPKGLSTPKYTSKP